MKKLILYSGHNFRKKLIKIDSEISDIVKDRLKEDKWRIL
jgi:hypothetical protein